MLSIKCTFTPVNGDPIENVYLPIYELSDLSSFESACRSISVDDPINGATAIASIVFPAGCSILCGGRVTNITAPDGANLTSACFGRAFLEVKGLTPNDPRFTPQMANSNDKLVFPSGATFSLGNLGFSANSSIAIWGLLCLDLDNFSEGYYLNTGYKNVNQSTAASNNGIKDANANTYWILNKSTKEAGYGTIGAPQLANWRTVIAENPPEPPPGVPTDPYDPDGETEPGGGDGEFDDPEEPVPIPDPPSISVADTGFVTLFNPSLSELKSLANYMWSDLFSVDSFKKIFADPMQAVLGLSIVPVNVPSAGSREVVVGNISTGVSMTVAAKQFVSVDCGSITVKKHWGAYLDYDPYTKSYIYLPFIGMHPVSTDDIMGRTIHVKYNVDILSGACTAFIESGGVVLYQFIGQLSSCIPITGDNFSSVINGVLGIAGSVGAMVATGGFSAPASVAEAGLGTAYTAGHFIGAGASVGQDIMNMKPSIEKSGAMSGTGGIMGVQKPYLIMMRPNAAIPGGQNQFLGYPAHITAKLGSLSGFTQVEIIHLENIPCTEKEQEEILHYLAGGVIL